MKIQIDGQGIMVTPALKELTLKKLERALSHIEKVNHVHITLKVENEVEQAASANISVPGTMIHADATSEDMYKTIDLLVNSLLTQLKKYKEKLKHHRD